jgi:ankyrin repeat protein
VSSALDQASSSGNVEAARILEMLLARGANPNRRLGDGRTPLFAAAEAGDTRVINTLLDHGARINELVLDETALDAAERSSQVAAARILHARGGRRAPKPKEQ